MRGVLLLHSPLSPFLPPPSQAGPVSVRGGDFTIENSFKMFECIATYKQLLLLFERYRKIAVLR